MPVTMDNDQTAFRTTSAGFELNWAQAEQPPASESLARCTPDYATSKEWASRPENAPPQTWWDDDTDAFAIDD